MRRVLFVTYYFPPIGGIGSIRASRFAACLPEFGWDAIVLAPASTPHEQDERLSFPEERVIRSRSIELARLGRVLPGGGGGSAHATAVDAAPGPGRAAAAARTFARSAAERLVFRPDAQVGWYPGAVQAGLRALRDQRFDAIFSSSFPATAHLIARTLSRRASLPWVAEFRDPYPDRNRRLAARLARAATKVVVPTPGMAGYYGREWDADITLITNGHDLAGVTPLRPERPTITHVGTYYPGRQDFRALWAALARMRRNGGDTVPRVRLVGVVPPELREELRSFGLAELVEETGFLEHEAALEAMLSSTVLIASGFRGGDALARGVIPAKLFEYLATGLPILYFGEDDDDAGTLLQSQPGTAIVRRDDVEGAVQALDRALAAGAVRRDVEQFSRRARARELAQVLDAAVAQRGTSSR